MRSPLHKLTVPHLSTLAAALQEKRLLPPFSVAAVACYIPYSLAQSIAHELQSLVDSGLHPTHIAFTLGLLRDEKHSQQKLDDRLELVWTGPNTGQSTLRDTAVVVRELLRSATLSALISTYSLDKPEYTRMIFGELAQNMELNPDLTVKMCVNIGREYHDKSPDSSVLCRFAQHFRQNLWPGTRLPEIFFDPRALNIDCDKRACLHAKYVIIDDAHLFITSANFSEAAHIRNIEAGILLNDPGRAIALRRQFESLVEKKLLHPLY
jgi:hypothetical protein